MVAIVWYGLSLIHLLIIEIVPPLRARMTALQESLAPDQAAIPFGVGVFTTGILGITSIVVVTAIWLLMRERAVFARLQNAP